MAGLPHFTHALNSTYVDDPIYAKMFETHFSNEYLNENCRKIDEKYCHFNINNNNGEIKILKILDELIRNKSKSDVEVFIYGKEGDILQIIVLEGFQFTKIKKLLNFSYTSQNILKPKVRFKYDKMKLYFDNKQYIRMKKLMKLQCL